MSFSPYATLQGYTTYDFAFRLTQSVDDKEIKSGKAKKKLFRYAQLHPTGISQKVPTRQSSTMPSLLR